ncbi:hypothetical protein GGI20_006175, partial [Coemansia sp. BCRC 34301]
ELEDYIDYYLKIDELDVSSGIIIYDVEMSGARRNPLFVRDKFSSDLNVIEGYYHIPIAL